MKNDDSSVQTTTLKREELSLSISLSLALSISISLILCTSNIIYQGYVTPTRGNNGTLKQYGWIVQAIPGHVICWKHVIKMFLFVM